MPFFWPCFFPKKDDASICQHRIRSAISTPEPMNFVSVIISFDALKAEARRHIIVNS